MDEPSKEYKVLIDCPRGTEFDETVEGLAKKVLALDGASQLEVLQHVPYVLIRTTIEPNTDSYCALTAALGQIPTVKFLGLALPRHCFERPQGKNAFYTLLGCSLGIIGTVIASSGRASPQQEKEGDNYRSQVLERLEEYLGSRGGKHGLP